MSERLDGFLDGLADDLLDRLLDRLAELPDDDPRFERIRARLAAPSTSPWLHGQREIAYYLKLPVSTVQKLTATNAVPVYRLADRRGVSARRDELDAWARTLREGPPAASPLRILDGGRPRGPRAR